MPTKFICFSVVDISAATKSPSQFLLVCFKQRGGKSQPFPEKLNQHFKISADGKFFELNYMLFCIMSSVDRRPGFSLESLRATDL